MAWEGCLPLGREIPKALGICLIEWDDGQKGFCEERLNPCCENGELEPWKKMKNHPRPFERPRMKKDVELKKRRTGLAGCVDPKMEEEPVCQKWNGQPKKGNPIWGNPP